MINYEFEDIYARRTGHGSLGMTNKYFKDNYWYKQNLRGYEGLSEEVCSILLKNSNLKDYVSYEQCMINGLPGCRSQNFISENESVITFQRLYFLTYGGNLKNKVNSYSTLNDRIQYVLDFIREYTGLNVSEYLANTLYFDMLTLNVDRHFGNLALIKGHDSWRTAPLFDFGASFFSLQHVFKPEMSLEEKYSILTPQPFASRFEEQASFLGNCNIKIDYVKVYDDLKQVEGLTDTISDVIQKQLERHKDIFQEQTVQKKAFKWMQHKQSR